MRALHILALAGFAWLTLGTAASADVRISIRDGQVSIAAKDATVRQILTEWARVGRTQIVNVERIPGAPITIELQNVPERDALDMLLRSISGYIAAPRAPFVSDASLFDRIVVMPTTAAPSTAASSAPPPFSQQSGNFQPAPDDDEQRPVVPPARGTIFSTFPQPQVANPRRVAVPSPTPVGEGGPPVAQPDMPVAAPQVPGFPQAQPGAAPFGAGAPFGAVAAPGMIAPVPAQQPGQVTPPAGQPRR